MTAANHIGSEARSLRLNILVVGSGISGLTAAILLREKGFDVTIAEASTKFSHVGAGLRVSPNASRIICRMGLRDNIEMYATPMKSINFYEHAQGRFLMEEAAVDMEAVFGAPFWQIHRADLHQVLLERAIEVGVIFKMGAVVEEYDWSAPKAILKNGEVLDADVILAADGYRSNARSNLLGCKDEPRFCGESAYRTLVPCSALQADPEVRKFTADHQVHLWIGEGRHVIIYTIRKGEYLNVVLTQPAVKTKGEKYLVIADPADILKEYEGWDPRVITIIKNISAADTLEWKLCDREPLESWVFPGGKIVLLGDACHPMLPSAGQGACMAIEDGAAIAELLGWITNKDQIPQALKTFQELRHGRCSAVTETARKNAERWHLKDAKPGASNAGIWDYDVEEAAREAVLLSA